MKQRANLGSTLNNNVYMYVGMATEWGGVGFAIFRPENVAPP